MPGAPTKPALDAALRKAAAVWLTPPGHDARLVWAVWPTRPVTGLAPGSLLVACGGTEQQVPGLVDGAAVLVTVAKPGSRSQLAAIPTVATLLEADKAVTAALRAARRNAAPGWTQVFALALLGSVAGSPAAPR